MKANRVWSYAIVAAMLLAAGSLRAAEPSSRAIAEKVARSFRTIEEFHTLDVEATTLGLRAWLFGGSAAAVTHHARGAATPANEFAEVFLSNQDVDIVVDGRSPDESAESLAHKAALLEEAMLRHFPHLPGERARWEVRLLRHARGEKAPLLGESYLWSQHNDSNSIGLVEVTEPSPGEARFRDGSHWDHHDSRFFTDASRGRITFLFAEGHHRTERSEEGLNPSIFAVVRFLTKKHQYGLETDDESLRHVRSLAAEFRVQLAEGTFPRNGYVARWLHHNVRKLLFNARDLNALWEELDRLDLRAALSAVGGDATQVDSVAWWLAKEPLPERPLGQGAGEKKITAPALGIDRVTHFTSDLPAYEAIRRSVGKPNVFRSRDGGKGERALFGDGFYVHPGIKEEAGGAFAVELRLHPDAVAGIDFHVIEETKAILVLNRAALQLVPAPPGGDPVQFFQDLAGQPANAANNLGILAQWRRRVASRFPSETPERRERVLSLVRQALAGPLDGSSHLLREWFLMPTSTLHPEFFQALVARVNEPAAKSLLLRALQTPHWRRAPQGQTGVFALLGAPESFFEGQDYEVAVASTVLRPEDAWSTQWFESAVFRLVLMHKAEHALLGGVFMAPGFTTAPRASTIVKSFLEFSAQPVESAQAMAKSLAWGQHPEALWVASAFVKHPNALAHLYRSPAWRPTFVRAGADLHSLGRFRRWLAVYVQKRSAPKGLVLPSACSHELAELEIVKQ